MLDLNFVRENIDKVRDALQARRADTTALDDFTRADEERRRVIAESDQFNAQRNASSREIGGLMKEGKKEEAEARKLVEDAKMLEACGCFGMVLEKIPAALAKEVSQSVHIPTIGIGAGRHADGQVLVMQDMLGITQEFKPRFLRRYADLHGVVTNAVGKYINDIKLKEFPNDQEQY